MRRKKKTHRTRADDKRLKPASMDQVTMGFAVEERYNELRGAYRRIKGVDLLAPQELKEAFQRFWAVRERHVRKEDYRISRAEWMSIKEIATWTVQVNAAIRNQPPVQLEWSDISDEFTFGHGTQNRSR